MIRDSKNIFLLRILYKYSNLSLLNFQIKNNNYKFSISLLYGKINEI